LRFFHLIKHMDFRLMNTLERLYTWITKCWLREDVELERYIRQIYVYGDLLWIIVINVLYKNILIYISSMRTDVGVGFSYDCLFVLYFGLEYVTHELSNSMDIFVHRRCF